MLYRSHAVRNSPLAPLCALLTACLCSTLSAFAAEPSAVENPAVAKAIVEAQKLASKKQWAASLAAIKRAQAVPDKSPYAEYKINEFLAYVLTQQRKYSQAAEVFERMIASGQTPKSKLDGLIKTVAQLYFNAEQYPRSIEYAQRGLKSEPGNTDLLELAGQAQYLTKAYEDAAETMQRLVKVTEAAGRKPEESWLRIILNSSYQRRNEAAASGVLQSLLRHYPKQEYWEQLFSRKDVKDYPERLRLGYYRLMLDLGVLRTPGDIEEMALSAIDAGTPAEAARVLEWAQAKNLFPEAGRARFERMLQFAREKVADNPAALAQLKETARAASHGQADAALGRAYLGSGHYDDAIQALQRALKKGDLVDRDEVRTNLVVAYSNTGELKQVKSTIHAMSPDSEWHDLATLWALRHQTKSAT